MAKGWDGIASGYAARVANHTVAFVPHLLQAAQVGDRKRVLDVACGTGVVALAAARVPGVEQIHACDWSAAMLQELRRDVASLPDGSASVEITECDAAALPMESESFDATVSNFGVVFVPDVAGGLKEMVRVTKRGGRVVYTNWGPSSAFQQIEDSWRDLYPQSAPEKKPGLESSALSQQLLDVGGVTDISVSEIKQDLVVATPEDYWDRMLVSSPARVVSLSKLSQEERDTVREKTVNKLRDQFGAEPITLPTLAYMAVATKV